MTGDQQRRAIEMKGAGASLREIAADVGVSHTSVRKFLSKQAERLPKAAALPSVPPPVATESEDSITFTRRMRDAAQQLAEEARRAGNFNASQKAVRDSAQFQLILARLEKAQASDADVLRISRADIAEGMAALQDRVRAITARPLLCADCGRKLAAEWGHGKGSEADHD